MIEGTFIDGASFDVVQSDGRSGACQFETIAAAQGDGTSADGLRAAVSAFILRRPDARVQYGAQLISIAELTEQLAGLSSRDYALKLSKCGVWGDGASFAVACHIDGLRGHVLLPCGHRCLCAACARDYEQGGEWERVGAPPKCPMCRLPVKDAQRVWG